MLKAWLAPLARIFNSHLLFQILSIKLSFEYASCLCC